MAARSVIKLFTKTCSYSTYSAPSYRSFSTSDNCRGPNKSHTYCRPTHESKGARYVVRKGSFQQIRKISKSYQNLKGYRQPQQRQEEHDFLESEHNPYPCRHKETRAFVEPRYITTRPLVDDEDRRIVYELDEGSKPKQNYFDVLDYMMKQENTRSGRLFSHLQPGSLAPYGSNENLYFPSASRRRPGIVYPVTKKSGEVVQKRFEDGQYRRYSNYNSQKEYPGYEETKKIAVCEKSSKDGPFNKKNYSTVCVENKKTASPSPRLRTYLTTTKKSTDRLGLTITKSSTRVSNTLLSKKRPEVVQNPLRNKIEEILCQNNLRALDHLYRRSKNTNLTSTSVVQAIKQPTKSDSRGSLKKSILNKQRSNPQDGRSFNTYTTDTSTKSGKYVAIKLEDSDHLKVCRRKKISFGKLPKMKPPDCPCLEEPPLKEGKPLAPLKKRFEPKERELDCDRLTCTTPRADANLIVKKKTLPRMIPKSCPCVHTEMVDFTIKRLPKKKIPEPEKICPVCVGDECCPPRSDRNLKVERKTLPKMKASNCPCIEPEPLKGKPLNRLKPAEVREPLKDCREENLCDNPRADDNLEVKKKSLPKLKPECVCIEPTPLDDVPPLKRLRKIKYIEKIRERCTPPGCEAAVRADDNLKIKPKKLPAFKPQNCPCYEEEMPSKMVHLKKLEPRNVPKEKEKICRLNVCDMPRADEGLKVKPKKLPKLTVKPCPCVEEILKDCPPLRRLEPLPVEEPPRICDPCIGNVCCPPRSDDGLKIQPKELPLLPLGSCPCVEEEPLKDAPPLAKLKKRHVSPPERDCVVLTCTTPRADDNLNPEAKKLPKLEINTCPCYEGPDLDEGIPLRRLPKVNVEEPPKICPHEDCRDTPRADEDCWLYWNKQPVEDKRCPGEPDLKNSSRRHYSTATKATFPRKPLKYDVASLGTNQITDKPYDIVIDIKPSPPLVLTQAPITAGPRVRQEARGKNSGMKPADYVSLIVYKNNNLGMTNSRSRMHPENGTKLAPFADVSFLFSTINRFISTYHQHLNQYANRPSKDHQTPSCECPPNDGHLQPKNPIIKEAETFMSPYPDEESISVSKFKSTLYERERKPDKTECPREEEEKLCEKQEERLCEIQDNITTLNKLCPKEASDECKKEDKLTVWEKVVNYFKARPNCPSPEEFKRMRLRDDAEKAASKAGLCLYDPKEMLKKNERELPKVITAKGTARDECCKN